MQSPNPNPTETPPTQTPSSQVLCVVGQHITQVLKLFLKDVCGCVLFSQRSLISVLGRTVGKHTNTLTAVIIHGTPTDSTYYWTLTLNRTLLPVLIKYSLWNTNTERTSLTVSLQWSQHKTWRILELGFVCDCFRSTQANWCHTHLLSWSNFNCHNCNSKNNLRE